MNARPKLLPDLIQELRPLGDIPTRRRVLLPVEDIHPYIRLAHCVTGTINIGPRIIYDHELVLITQGQGRLLFPPQEFVFGPRDLFLIPPFVPHHFITGSQICRHIAVHFDLAPDTPPRARTSTPRPYTVDLSHGHHLPLHCVLMEDDPVRHLLLRLIDLRQQNEPLNDLQARAELLRVLLILLGRQKRADANKIPPQNVLAQARMTKALGFIRQNWKRIRAADEIASAAGVSTSQINRISRAWTGESIMQILRRTRIEHARSLLARGDLSVKEVAAACGFSDAFHFSKVFRRIDGLSPSEYQSTVLKKSR